DAPRGADRRVPLEHPPRRRRDRDRPSGGLRGGRDRGGADRGARRRRGRHARVVVGTEGRRDQLVAGLRGARACDRRRRRRRHRRARGRARRGASPGARRARLSATSPHRSPLLVGGREVRPGTTVEFQLKISEFYTASPVNVPVTVIRGPEDGPIVFLVAAIHGDELNGVEIVRRSLLGIAHDRIKGALVCVPVVNRFGFLNRPGYVPDRRDLNRSFPGSATGTAASRVAAAVFREIVVPATAGLDFHTAAFGRVNLPHLRADMRDPTARRLARWFGVEI